MTRDEMEIAAEAELAENNARRADDEAKSREDLARVTGEYCRQMRDAGRADLVRGFHQ